MGAYLGKGSYWQFFHKLNSRETSLLNAANHLKIFLIEFEICLYEHLYFLYIRNPLFPIVAFISMFWQLKCFIQKIVFQLYKTSQSAITFDRGACSTHCLQYCFDKTNIFFTLSMKNVLFILDILFSVTMVTC